jgi:hypothetical protein
MPRAWDDDRFVTLNQMCDLDGGVIQAQTL